MIWRLAFLLLFLAAPAWSAALRVTVDLSEQRMTVQTHGVTQYSWPVSTARPGKVTPVGTYVPQVLKRMHYSTLYNNAPMPWSIFFRGNYAIHGTNQVDRLGTPASAGCIRLAPENARTLYQLVRELGKSETRIVIQP